MRSNYPTFSLDSGFAIISFRSFFKKRDKCCKYLVNSFKIEIAVKSRPRLSNFKPVELINMNVHRLCQV